MGLTEEQKAIIRSVDDSSNIIKIMAAAGSGKTFTLTELARNLSSKDPGAKILYLVYNKSMQLEAQHKFIDQPQVEIMTTYSLAYRIFIRAIGSFKACNSIDYTIITDELTKYKKQYRYTKHRYFHELLAEYCRSWSSLDAFMQYKYNEFDKQATIQLVSIGFTSVEKLGIKLQWGGILIKDYLDIFYNIMKRMLKEKLYTHSMYVKEAAKINNSVIYDNYQYVLLDEAQDTNKFVLEIFNKIRAKKKYLVGDPYQAIYQFNGCINAFDELEGSIYNLSKSFRFGQNIADLASNIGLDMHITGTDQPEKHEDTSNQTVLLRTNAGILSYAISLVDNPELADKKLKINYMNNNSTTENKSENTLKDSQKNMIYYLFYTFKNDLCDYHKVDELMNMFNFNKYPHEPDAFNILTNYINEMKIKKYVDITLSEAIADIGAGAIDSDIVKIDKLYDQYGTDITQLLWKLIQAENETNPDVTYTLITAHRSKGLEWDSVIIGQDEGWSLYDDNGNRIQNFYDELNLHYVAITRARYKLDATELYAQHRLFLGKDAKIENYTINNFTL